MFVPRSLIFIQFVMNVPYKSTKTNKRRSVTETQIVLNNMHCLLKVVTNIKILVCWKSITNPYQFFFFIQFLIKSRSQNGSEI